MRPAAAMALLGLACGCGVPLVPAEQKKPPALPVSLMAKKANLPTLSQLPCFECHRLGVFEQGLRFPHTTSSHVELGHCHRCHRSGGHHGTTIDLAPCQECHDELPNRAPHAPAAPTPAVDAAP